MSKRVRHSLQLAAHVGSKHHFAQKLFLKIILMLITPLEHLHRLVMYAYSHITPPCFYTPKNEFHVSLDDQLEAIALSLSHKQKKIIHLHQQKQKRIKLLLISFALLLIAFKHHHDANAATSTANIGVSASVSPKCKVYSSTLAFGSYDPTLNTNLDVNGSVLISCTKNTAATIAMDNGTYSSHATGGATRAMQNTGGGGPSNAYMSYELYKNSTRTSVWSTSSPLSITATTSAQVAVPVYGRVPQGQNVQNGGYLDTVVVTVNF